MHEHQRVHLETQLHDRTGLGEASIEDHPAVVRDGDLAEPVDVGREIPAPKPVLARLDQKRVISVLRPFVAERLIALFTPPFGYQRSRRVSADGVMPTVGVPDDRAKNPAHVGIQAMALGQFERVLTLERVRRVIALERVLRVIEQHPRIRTALQVRQAQQRAAADVEGPMLPALDDGFVTGTVFGRQLPSSAQHAPLRDITHRPRGSAPPQFRRSRRCFVDFGIPHGVDHPEDAQLLDIDLPGFCPAVYPRDRDARTASLGPDTRLRRAGTLDAH